MKATAQAGKLKALQLAAIIFLTISGGPYGLEPLLSYVGAHGAFMLLILVPVFWDIPTVFTVLELNSMMPVEGGYYQWVKRAMGLRFAWYEGIWTWLYTFVDLAIYPVLFTTYLSYFFPAIEAFKIPICLIIIWSCALLNIRGIVMVGRASIFLGIAILIPLFTLLFYFVFTHHGEYLYVNPSLDGLALPAIGMGCYTVMWNFLGWDNVTTYAEEVAHPVKAYLRSVAMAFVLIALVYLATIFVATQSRIDFTVLNSEGIPVLGKLIGGEWLGALLAAGGMASGLGLYSGVLLSVSRVPSVMAEDRMLPDILHKQHARYKTPYISIIVCSAVVSLMILLSFQELLIMDVIVYGAALILEFVSLIILRKKLPDAERPFRIPLNIGGLCVMIALPLSIYVIALTGAIMSEDNAMNAALLALVAIVSAEIVWRLFIAKRTGYKSA